MAISGAPEHPGEDLYLDCANVNMPVVPGYRTIGLKKLMLGELGKVYTGSLCIPSYNCIRIYNYLTIESLI